MTIAVAMSGGVDSSVAALLLKRAGHDVVGLTMRLFEDEDRASLREISDASGAAARIGIPHHVIDLAGIFRSEIILNFAEQYCRGLTPNPCALCNRRIKFGALMETAMKMGADKFATGHHARIANHGGRLMVSRAKDRDKDQSYFLFTLTNDDLESVVFPVGDYTKDEIRLMAREAGLDVADKRDSLEICFVKGDDYAATVEKYAASVPPPGELVLSDGTVVGTHGGIHKYTVGQRKGLKVAMGRPMYVLGIDAPTNRVIIGDAEKRTSRGLVAKNAVWNYNGPFGKGQVDISVRYRARPVAGELHPLGEDRIRVLFREGNPLATPGQAAVFYRGDLVLGGGWIEEKL